MTKLEFQSEAANISGVRGRIVIGAIVVAVIGTGAFCYSNYARRRENSIEYHKAEYVAAKDGRPNPVRSLWAKVTGRKPPHRISFEKLRRHDEALLRLGYWREQTVVVSNKPASTVWGIAVKNGANLWQPELTKEVCVVAPIRTNAIIVRAVPDHIPIWERLIRDADGRHGE